MEPNEQLVFCIFVQIPQSLWIMNMIMSTPGTPLMTTPGETSRRPESNRHSATYLFQSLSVPIPSKDLDSILIVLIHFVFIYEY